MRGAGAMIGVELGRGATRVVEKALSRGVVLLTEKDAVKCAGLFEGEAWVLPVSAEMEPGDPSLIERILEKLNGRKTA